MDAQRRALERAAAQGDHEAAARLLQARLRAGDLTAEALELAALLGDAAALRLLGEAAPTPLSAPATPDALREWVWALRPCGAAAIVRAVCAAADLLLQEVEERLEDPEAPLAALEAARGWSDERRAATPAAIERLFDAAGFALRVAEDAASRDHACSLAVFACYHAARTAAVAARGEGFKPLLQQAAQVLRTAQQGGASPGEIAAAVQADLMAWALEPRARA